MLSSEPAKGRKRCGAKKKDGKPCRRWPMKGRKRCKFHGGATPRGTKSANFKHGRYAEEQVTDLFHRIDELAGDPRLFDLRRDAATIQYRIDELLRTLPAGGGSDTYFALLKGYADQWKAAIGAKKPAKADGVIEQMMKTIEEADEVFRTWDQVDSLTDSKVKIIDKERRHAMDNEHMIRLERAVLMMTTLIELVNNRIIEALPPATANPLIDGISNDVRTVFGSGNRGES